MKEQRIICVSAKVFNVNPNDLLARNRKASVVNPRHAAVAIIRKRTNLHLCQIASLFGRSHATIINSIIRFNEYYATELSYRMKADAIEMILDAESDERHPNDFLPFIYTTEHDEENKKG